MSQPKESSLKLKFRSRLKRISPAINYFDVDVPQTISRRIGIRGAVPVMASVNGSTVFRGSLYPVGDGQHCMRIKAAIRNEVGLVEGGLVRVEITVLDRSKKDQIPKALQSALRSSGLSKAFELIPSGRRNYLLRWIGEAAKPETQQKRIQEALTESKRRLAAKKQ